MAAGTITALRAQANDPQRVNIFIDGVFTLGVSLTTLGQARLYVGKVVSAEEYEQLEAAEQSGKAFQAALRFLEARPRSTSEIRERLRRKEFAPQAIEQAIARLTELELVDDAAFARRWVENRQASRPRGALALRDELRRKGLDRSLIEGVLEDQTLMGDQAEQALAVAQAAMHKYAGAADRARFSRRLGSFLQRRGFNPDVIRPIVERLWEERTQSQAQLYEADDASPRLASTFDDPPDTE